MRGIPLSQFLKNLDNGISIFPGVSCFVTFLNVCVKQKKTIRFFYLSATFGKTQPLIIPRMLWCLSIVPFGGGSFAAWRCTTWCTAPSSSLPRGCAMPASSRRTTKAKFTLLSRRSATTRPLYSLASEYLVLMIKYVPYNVSKCKA